MVILRPTRKLHDLLPPAGKAGAESDTALGDWYVNRISVDRRPLLLLVSSTSLLPMLVPARGVRGMPSRLPQLVASCLRRHGVAPHLVAAEVDAMSSVVIAPTLDRSVLGIMIDFAKSIPYHLDAGDWDDTTLPFVEAQLAETPCYAGRRFEEVVWPKKAAPSLLQSKWGAG